MGNILLNGISTVIINGIITILGLCMTALIGKVYSYLNKKKQAEIIKIGADLYNSRFTVAKGIVYQVEQLFKLVPGAGDLKATMFDKLLLDKFPKLTQVELDHFRESIVGEINSKTSVLLAPAFDPLKDEADVKVTKPVDQVMKTKSITNPMQGQSIVNIIQ